MYIIKVLFYETEAGETPVETFIQSLSVKHRGQSQGVLGDRTIKGAREEPERTLRETDPGRALSQGIRELRI